jgi:hypothetical protein
MTSGARLTPALRHRRNWLCLIFHFSGRRIGVRSSVLALVLLA